MIRWIVFDAMGVIFEEGDDVRNALIPFLRRRGCAADEEKIQALYRRASLGEIAGREFWIRLGYAGESPAIEKEYLDACLAPDPQFAGTAAHLAERFSLAVLSNDVGEWSSYLRRKHGLDRFFQAVVISSEARVRKPAPEIYRILLERLQADGTECIFIDDRIPNLAPAAELGIVPVWFARDDSPPPRNIPHRIRGLPELVEAVAGK
jgi:FMN phosphatase YigB (HAD superfamily)